MKTCFKFRVGIHFVHNGYVFRKKKRNQNILGHLNFQACSDSFGWLG